MKFEGQFTVPANRETAFEKLNDPEFFASCLDGISDLEEIDPEHYSAVLETRLAYIRFRFEVQVLLVEVEAPVRVVARIEGVPKGVVGRLVATAEARLEQHGQGTRVHYDMDVALAGKLGSMGQPVLRSKAKEMERSFVAKATLALEKEQQT